MANQNDVRRIALSLPEVQEEDDGFAFSIVCKGKRKGLCWAWRERVEPKKPRVASRVVLAVRVASLTEKELLLASDEDRFFTEPHYNGFPAVLVRLPRMKVGELRQLLIEAWRCTAPRALVQQQGDRLASRSGSGRASSPRERRKRS
jgi:hypothetical protein